MIKWDVYKMEDVSVRLIWFFFMLSFGLLCVGVMVRESAIWKTLRDVSIRCALLLVAEKLFFCRMT
jgi:hypothetical protein